MSDTVIKVENLSKRYRIGGAVRYKTFRETLTDLARFAFQSRSKSKNHKSDTIWALKDVSFQVKQGEVVGIIGRNGAGKTTLLKILSRITEPTRGRIELRGRIGSLLEVGTGFHPELTGHENVYLYGAILGMDRWEVTRKFDEIVAFAELEKFIETPVKRYSSGMYMRLAFAVAAHLEPDILLIDEVLAVGDAAFQKKCIGKMDDVSKEGRTVLFVSHNMAAVSALCNRGIVFESGIIVKNESIHVAVEHYLNTLDNITGIPLIQRSDRQGNQVMRLHDFTLTDLKGRPIKYAHSGQDIAFSIYYESDLNASIQNVNIEIGVHGKYDEYLFHLSTNTKKQTFQEIPAKGLFSCKVYNLPLQPGAYYLNLFCTVAGEIADWIQNAVKIEVNSGDFFHTGKLPPTEQGPFLVEHSWEVKS